MLLSATDALRAAVDAHITSLLVLIKVLEPVGTALDVCRTAHRDVLDPMARCA